MKNKHRKSNVDCAIIPAYNEEKTISRVVSAIKRTGLLPMVIDDNSSDRTSEIAKKSGAVVIRQKANMGKGEAIKTGIKYVFDKIPRVENFVLIDADMQYNPKDAKLILGPLKNDTADLVMGYRDWSSVPFRHRMGNFVWRVLFNTLFGTRLKDTNCGFMGMSKNAARILRKALYGGYIIENAILIEAVKKNLRIAQVPVDVLYNHRSRVARGVRMVGGIFLFILKEGIKYRLVSK